MSTSHSQIAQEIMQALRDRVGDSLPEQVRAYLAMAQRRDAHLIDVLAGRRVSADMETSNE